MELVELVEHLELLVLTEAYHDQQPQKPGPEVLFKDWEKRVL